MEKEDYRWVKLKTGENRLVTGIEEKKLRREAGLVNILDEGDNPNARNQDDTYGK